MEDLVRSCLGFRLGSAWRRVDRLFNRAFKRVGLTHAHGHVLACLLAHGDMRLVDIARRTGFEPSTVSRLVKELVRRKLARRSPDPSDGRARLVGPAKRGEALRKDIEGLVQRAEERLRRDVAQADLEGFLTTTQAIDKLP